MARIDKTYCTNYKNYQDFLNWSKDKTVTFFNGYKRNIFDYIYIHLKEEDFKDGKERSIMNTPYWIDIFLIQNCPIEFVQERMKEVYSEDYDKLSKIDLTSPPPEDCQQNRKIVIEKYRDTCYPIHNKPFRVYHDYKHRMIQPKWWLQTAYDSKGYWLYDEYSDIWSRNDWYYPSNTNTAFISSVKALIRHLRKQYLPVGLEFTFSGNYVGENYKVTIKN